MPYQLYLILLPGRCYIPASVVNIRIVSCVTASHTLPRSDFVLAMLGLQMSLSPCWAFRCHYLTSTFSNFSGGLGNEGDTPSRTLPRFGLRPRDNGPMAQEIGPACQIFRCSAPYVIKLNFRLFTALPWNLSRALH